MKNTAITLLTTLLIQPCFAEPTPRPAACPSIEMVKLGGVDKAFYDPVHGWVATTNYSKYDTDVLWSFGVIEGKSVKNAEDAVYKAKQELRGIRYTIGPFEYERTSEHMKRWACSYQGDNVFAYAATPTLPDVSFPTSISGQ